MKSLNSFIAEHCINSFIIESRVTGHELLNIFVQSLDTAKNGIDVADDESESAEFKTIKGQDALDWIVNQLNITAKNYKLKLEVPEEKEQ